MTDKVQKILNEITTRKLCTMDEHMAFYNDKAKEDYQFLSEIEELIKALPEEPVSEYLEEAAEMFIDSLIPTEVDTVTPFAAEYVIGLLNKAIEFGANWQKEQLMAKAVDGFVIEDIEEGNGDFLLSADYLSKDMGLKDRQKVKVIVIKED